MDWVSPPLQDAYRAAILYGQCWRRTNLTTHNNLGNFILLIAFIPQLVHLPLTHTVGFHTIELIQPVVDNP